MTAVISFIHSITPPLPLTFILDSNHGGTRRDWLLGVLVRHLDLNLMV